ncbi:hypothetical protein KQI15_14785, partial [Intestinimonas butyriciproducens]|nr:hypothetical protein [Intestinimonas butyriciproducens]
EEKITLGEKADSLKSQAEALAEGAFGASDKMQEVRDVELDLISAIRENTKALGEAAYLGDYEKQQELSKGRGLNGNVTADSSYRSLRERDFGPHAYGLDYVPYDNFPALLHQGERVLTASQARAADRGMGVNVTFSGPVTVREEADLDRLAAKLAANVVRAAELGV